MTIRRALAAALLLLLAAPAPAAPDRTTPDLAADIDPFIGTGGHGHTFPGATVPFGMVQLSPDTRLTGWDGCSGYHFSDDVVYGFSHTHLSGTGVSDYGDILLMPGCGAPHWENGYPDDPDGGYGSRFSKADEQAAAGWYRTVLADDGIEIELTATPRTGLHRYVFPAGRPAHVIIDLEHRDKLLDSGLDFPDDRTVTGFRRSQAWARDQLVHFRAAFSRPFSVTLNDAGTKAVLAFGDAGGEVLVQVAISAVDGDGARRNLEAEWAGFDFAATRRAAFAAWSDLLAAYAVPGDTPAAERAVLATAIYHTSLAPNLFSDVDGRYRGLDRDVHRAVGRDQYTVFSLWDTYRATHPLFTLMQRARTADFADTALSHYLEGGRLPVWELAGNETDCMIGYHSVSFLADAWLKGIRGFDPQVALAAMRDSANRDHFGLAAYRRQGFIGVEDEPESVSKTLEYAYDDACIARFARALGDEDTAQEFGRRAQAWRHLFDPVSRCFRPRRNGQFLAPYDPRQVDNHHTEANGWQYRFAAPHHMREHIESLGGDDALVAVLDSLFTVDSATTGRDQADITGRIGQYAHGNEPSHHVGWLYHFAGAPEKSYERIAAILDRFYTAAPDGLIGNEDCGQMSAWYVLAAYGLYDVAPTSGQWLLVPPRHAEMSLRFEDGKVFTTRRTGTGPVRRVTWRGEELTRSWLSHAEVSGGGELVFELGPGGSAWGRAPGDRPGTEPVAAPIVAAPWATAPGDRFRDQTMVSLAALHPRAQIRWTDKPHRDPREGTPYTGPLYLERSTELRFVAVVDDRTSPVITARFDAIEHGWQVTTATPPNAQYTAGGPDALIDGRRAGPNWRTGGWQGYDGRDFVATVDLGQALPVREVGLGLLQDAGSWIFLPREVVVEVSADGERFVPAGRVGHDVPDRTDETVRRDLTVEMDGTPVRAVRVRAVNFGPVPDWHPGAGGASFLFVDEVIVR